MSDENSAGASYLAALKRSTGSEGSAAAPARAPGAGPSSSDVAPDTSVALGRTGPVKEKRKSPRYRCQGSAQLREVTSGVATWATFSDISLHGCYVEAAAGYPVNAVVALAIEVNGFRVEATGQVKASYPGLGMGISFSSVSEGDRERLRALVRSLSQPSVIMGARVQERAPAILPSNAAPTSENSAAVLQAITKFFEDRHVMGREEFLRILRKARP